MNGGGRRGVLTLALAAVVAAVMLGVVVIGAQVSAPTPHLAGRIDPGVPHASTRPGGGGAASGPAPLGPARPVSLSIPAIGVRTVVNPIGLAADGSLAVPQPGARLDEAAWFRNSPTRASRVPRSSRDTSTALPARRSSSVSARSAPVTASWYVAPTGRVLTFRVDAVRDFLKDRFPTTLVYGGRHLGQPTLRLITCSDFDASIGHHLGNEVVFAHLAHATASTD